MPATAAGSQTGSGLARKVCFTERTDKERKPIKMNMIPSANGAERNQFTGGFGPGGFLDRQDKSVPDGSAYAVAIAESWGGRVCRRFFLPPRAAAGGSGSELAPRGLAGESKAPAPAIPRRPLADTCCARSLAGWRLSELRHCRRDSSSLPKSCCRSTPCGSDWD